MGSALTAYLRRRGVLPGDGALAILGWEAEGGDIVKSRRGPAIEVLRRHGAVALGKRPGGAWHRHRFDGPHLRDALMDAGYLVETVETSTTWSDLSSLRAAIHDALDRSLTSSVTRPYVMTHISHVYETGASLYTTVIAVANQADLVGQWTSAKAAVSDAIVSGGGTITHHHAIGRDHARWLSDEVGALGVETLRAVKSTLDPRGICNPGVLGLT
jgi:alkyldihydroxyacetonephosphate synthase